MFKKVAKKIAVAGACLGMIMGVCSIRKIDIVKNLSSIVSHGWGEGIDW